MTVDVLDHEIIIATTKEHIQQCLDVRIQVFHHEQKFPLETEIDEFDDPQAATTHFLLRLLPSLQPIGTIRGVRLSSSYYKIGRLAVLDQYRKFKLGKELLLGLREWVKIDASPMATMPEHDVSASVVCHSQIPVKGFYAKFGYISEGAEFDEDGEPHQKMVLQLPLMAPKSSD
ncbi:acyl-CoA N-acyltransferase [Guyanagaster necrorhizus]|uniref:Acyl-CoA N-acyltransferase n=1 Tax=Guyanagaster necrorhizus TaxID=856835 RepID=A0A9P8AV17_9AGAR|nr:acyl-CoA N-acyltransferase [Guyanagaster necrorhizus MCA 3950]KAG7447472.1 acyl-CoA N-acyltransferase [Guyanagaster necrorhizus MCA 3950]